MKDPVLNKNADRLIYVAKPSLGKEEELAVAKAVKENWISQGKRVAEFERLVSYSCHKAMGSACNSGTTALHLALHVCDISEGDEVIIPNLAMIALANSVLLTGATPVFADSDINSEVGNISLNTIKTKITEKTKAVILVHTYGEPVIDTAEILEYCKSKDIKVIEDCAEAHFATFQDGRPVGSIGDLAVFSFYSNKNITTGEGGMVCTDSSIVKNRLDRVRMHAFTPGQHFCHTEKAFGYRMTDLQAAIGIEQMKKSKFFMKKRQIIRSIYDKHTYNNKPYLNIANHSLKMFNSGLWVLPVLAANKEIRENARDYFAYHGIDTRTYFQPMNKQSFLTKYANGDYTVSENLADRGFYLPLYPAMKLSEILYVVKVYNEFQSNHGKAVV